MNKKRAPKSGYATIPYARFCTTLVWTILWAVCSGCLSPGKGTSKEATASPTVQGQSIARLTSQSSPSSFEYVELLDRSHWLVAESNRLLRTENAGRKWTQTFTVKSPTDNGDEIQGLSFINQRLGFLIVSGQLLRTNDGGTNWTTLGLISETEKIQYKSCRFVDAMHGWVVGMLWLDGWVNDPNIPRYVGVAFSTHDGGQTWNRRQLDLPKGYRQAGTYWSLNDVFFKDAKTGWVVGDRGTIFGTGDGGETWRFVPSQDVDYQRIRFLKDGFGWATYKYGNSSWGVAVTVDGEQRWKLLKESFVQGTWPVFAVFRSPQHGFAISRKLYETSDGGQRWKALSDGDKVDEIAYGYLGQATDGTIVVLGLKGSILSSLISTDFGSTWQSDY